MLGQRFLMQDVDDDTVDRHALQLVVLVSAILSVAGTTVMGVLFLCIPRLRKYPARITAYLGLSNWLWFLSILFGMVDVDNKHDTVCKYAGPLNQVFGLSSIFWTCAIALHMALIVSRDTPPGQKLEIGYHAVVWLLPVALVLCLLFTLRDSTPDYIRTKSNVCYVSDQHAALRFITQSGPSIIGFLFNLIAYSWALCKARAAVRHRKRNAEEDDLSLAQSRAVAKRVITSASKYLLVYLVCWAPSVGQDLELLTSKPGSVDSDWVWVVYASEAIFFSQGFLNSIVYIMSKWHVLQAVIQARRSQRRVSDIGTALLSPERRQTRVGSVYDSEYQYGVQPVNRAVDDTDSDYGSSYIPPTAADHYAVGGRYSDDGYMRGSDVGEIGRFDPYAGEYGRSSPTAIPGGKVQSVRAVSATALSHDNSQRGSLALYSGSLRSGDHRSGRSVSGERPTSRAASSSFLFASTPSNR